MEYDTPWFPVICADGGHYTAWLRLLNDILHKYTNLVQEANAYSSWAVYSQ